ncbi:Endophilin-A2 [Dirofilaria immitis]|nr:Endophilin-A2 [Dirofilaria immitis]
MGAAEPTKLDEQYNEMERKVDLTYELINALIAGTHELLQPNPATRAKMATMGALSKVRGTSKAQPYPQTEGLLADIMQKYGTALGADSDLGKALLDASEAYRQLADIKYQMEDNHHRTKLKGRRLDYDCKKRKQTRDEELIQAEDKLEESKQLAEQAMHNLLSNDVEQVTQLCALVDAQLDFHRQTTQVLKRLKTQLNERVGEASTRLRVKHVIKPVLADRVSSARSPVHAENSISINNANFQPSSMYAQKSTADNINWDSSAKVHSSTASFGSSNAPSSSILPILKPSCRALYDFEAQNEAELDFKEGDIISLISQIDENWYEGSLLGKTGYFPISYVHVLVPL